MYVIWLYEVATPLTDIPHMAAVYTGGSNTDGTTMVLRMVGCDTNHLICRATVFTQIEDQSNQVQESLERWFPVHFWEHIMDVADNRVRCHTVRSWTTASTRLVYKNELMIMQGHGAAAFTAR